MMYNMGIVEESTNSCTMDEPVLIMLCMILKPVFISSLKDPYLREFYFLHNQLYHKCIYVLLLTLHCHLDISKMS